MPQSLYAPLPPEEALKAQARAVLQTVLELAVAQLGVERFQTIAAESEAPPPSKNLPMKPKIVAKKSAWADLRDSEDETD